MSYIYLSYSSLQIRTKLRAPPRQSRDLAVGEMADQVVGNCQQVSLLKRSRYALEDRSQDTMASRNGQFLLFDSPTRGSSGLQVPLGTWRACLQHCYHRLYVSVRLPALARLTRQEEKKGLYDTPSEIGTFLSWQKALASRGVRLSGHRLLRAS